MLKQNQRSKNLSLISCNTLCLNKIFLLGFIACILSVLLVTEKASAKELRLNLTESLNMDSSGKKLKDSDQKTKSQEKKVAKVKEPKKLQKAKPKNTKSKISTKTKHDTAKNSISNVR